MEMVPVEQSLLQSTFTEEIATCPESSLDQERCHSLHGLGKGEVVGSILTGSTVIMPVTACNRARLLDPPIARSSCQ